MGLKVAVQMDHISSINIAGDSAFAMMLEAQSRGHELYHYTPESLSMVDGRVFARPEPVTVRDEAGDHFTLGTPEKTDLTEFDVVLMRQDPPFNLAYITTTHLLERIHPKTLVVNNPREVRNAPEKLLVTEFPELMPPTLISRDEAAIREFRAEHGDIVVKPLYGHGGAAVFRLAAEDQNYGSLIALFTEMFSEAMVVQKFLPDVKAGDKRIILVDGEFAGAVNRVPAADDLRSNMVVGGQAVATELTPREQEICEAIGPTLKRLDLTLVGIDVIGGKLTEINVTAPTGLRAIRKLGGPDIAAKVWDSIEARRG